MADPSAYTVEHLRGMNIFTIYDSDPETITALLEDMYQHYLNHPPDALLQTFIDASRLIMKAYIIRRVILFGRQATERPACVAMIPPECCPAADRRRS